MAVNTRNKRGSCLGLALACLVVYPNPSGTIGQAGRQQTAACYAAILAGAAVPPFVAGDLTRTGVVRNIAGTLSTTQPFGTLADATSKHGTITQG